MHRKSAGADGSRADSFGFCITPTSTVSPLDVSDPLLRLIVASPLPPLSRSVKELEQVIFDLSGCLPPPASDDGNVLWGVKRALGWCNSADDEVLVVTGSVFIMADAREALGVDEPRVGALASISTAAWSDPQSKNDCNFSFSSQDAPIIAEVAGSNWKSMQDVMPP
jgi:hypothetical protein